MILASPPTSAPKAFSVLSNGSLVGSASPGSSSCCCPPGADTAEPWLGEYATPCSMGMGIQAEAGKGGWASASGRASSTPLIQHVGGHSGAAPSECFLCRCLTVCVSNIRQVIGSRCTLLIQREQVVVGAPMSPRRVCVRVQKKACAQVYMV